MSNHTPKGFYSHPNDNALGFWCDGEGNTTEPFSKEKLIAMRIANGEPAPVFWPYSTAVPAVTHAPEWIRVGFPNHPSSRLMMRYFDRRTLSEYFDGRTVIDDVMMPEFYRQGGSAEWAVNGYPDNCSDHDIFQLVWNKVTADDVRNFVGEDAVPMYNNGPRWIVDEENPNLARWWDGDDFTGETEFVGVIQQLGFDTEVDTKETVPNAPGLSDSEAGDWHVDPSDSSQLIRWGGTRWDKRKSLDSTIAGLFADLGEDVPAMWSGVQYMSPRHSELMAQLSARKEGVNGWYKEPERFDDLRMRVWHEGQWTDQTSQQVPGFYDDPFNDELLREWNNGWTNNVVTKEAERIRLEREALRREKRAALVEKVAVGIANHYSPENRRQRRIDEQNDRSRRLRDAAAAAALERHQGGTDYWQQKAYDRRWK